MLIYCVQHLLRQILGMDDHQDIDVLLNAVTGKVDSANFVELSNQVHYKPGWGRLSHCGIKAAIDFELSYQANHRSIRFAHGSD